MPDRTTLVGAIGSIGALLLVLELVRRRHLREEYALLWLATGAVLLLLSLSRPLLDTLAELTGIFYPPSALFLVALLFVLAILLHFSIILTRLTQQNRELPSNSPCCATIWSSEAQLTRVTSTTTRAT